MNLSHCKRPAKAGFTLVELLVVIGIIAILAGVTLAGVGSAIRMAKKTKASNTATAIATAIQNYDTEYGVYPSAGTGGKDDYYDGGAQGQWPAMTITLCGNINPSTGLAGGGLATNGTTLNARGIQYLAPTHSDVDGNGAIVNPFATVATGKPATINPSGGGVGAPYFFMVVDTDYSGMAGDTSGTKPPDFTQKTVGTTPLQNGTPGGVAVWCSCDQKTVGSPSNFWAHTY